MRRKHLLPLSVLLAAFLGSAAAQIVLTPATKTEIRYGYGRVVLRALYFNDPDYLRARLDRLERERAGELLTGR